jgi:hypothetical protein
VQRTDHNGSVDSVTMKTLHAVAHGRDDSGSLVSSWTDLRHRRRHRGGVERDPCTESNGFRLMIGSAVRCSHGREGRSSASSGRTGAALEAGTMNAGTHELVRTRRLEERGNGHEDQHERREVLPEEGVESHGSGAN